MLTHAHTHRSYGWLKWDPMAKVEGAFILYKREKKRVNIERGVFVESDAAANSRRRRAAGQGKEAK